MSRTSYEVGDSERETLLYYLDKMRDHVVRAAEGLTAEQRGEPGVASGTNLRWLIEHLTAVEQHWFRLVFLGADSRTIDFVKVSADATHEDVVAAYRKACARSDEIVRGCPDLSRLSAIANPGEPEKDTLRSVIAHMIEETARPAGHADILRERIDGATDL